MNKTIVIDEDTYDHLLADALPGERFRDTIRRRLELPAIRGNTGRNLTAMLAGLSPGDSIDIPAGKPGQVDGRVLESVSRQIRRVRREQGANLVQERHLVSSDDYPGQLCVRINHVL